MALATYKDLCIDAVDPAILGPFWAALLGRDLEMLADGDAVLRGDHPASTIWINRVAERPTTKHRMHIDVHAASVEDAIDLGATVIDADSFRWTVMADPEGGEFCVFVRPEVPPERLYEMIIHTVDHTVTAPWWHALLGGRLVTETGASALEEIPGAPFECLVFVDVPEPKTIKNRIHIDVVSRDLDELLAAGATLLRARDDEIGWDVLADPEGNEFCRFDSAD